MKNFLIIFFLKIISDFVFLTKFNFFRRNSVMYGTPCRTIGHFVFFIITMLLTGHHAMPLVIQSFFTASATDLRECFLLSGIFYLHSFLLVLRPPWGRQFSLNISRASCGYFRNIDPSRLFVSITTIHNKNIRVTFTYGLRLARYEVLDMMI